MNPPNNQDLTLVLRHIGERLAIRRTKNDSGIEELRLERLAARSPERTAAPYSL